MLRYLYIVLLFSCFLACNQSPSESAPPSEMDQEITVDSLDLMIGQMIMIGFRGMTADSVSPKIKQAISDGWVGGIVLFDYDVRKKEFVRNIRSPKQVKSLVTDVRKLSPVPLLVAIDQEGGKVNRLKERYGFNDLASAAKLGEMNNLDSTRHYAAINAGNLAALGFDVNFAPVVDLNVNPDNPAIGKLERSFGGSIETVTQHASIWIEEHAKRKILSTLKHFPGHGSSNADSHAGLTDVTDTWTEAELEPFKQVLQNAPLTSVMTAHVFNRKLDEEYPATLSPKVIDHYIRGEFGFDGLVFSDDLQMGAVHALYDFPTILERVILAGSDILVFGNNLEYDEDIPEKAVAIIKQLVADGRLSRERISASYARIMKVKGEL